MRVEFSPPDITQAEIDQVVEALKSGWITTGPKTKELEREVAQLCGTNKACCLNSATAALEMCLHLLGIGEGDEVIVPAYTYTATASPVCHVGATPVMVDVAPGSYQMDYDAMEAAITERTKAIIPVDLGGVPCDYDRIFAAVEAKRDLYHPAEGLQQAFDRCIVITDAAHAYGASYKGTPVGSVADFSSFSFHAVKNFTTAEGGALTWRSREGIDDEAVYKQLQLFSLHGQSKDALSKIVGIRRGGAVFQVQHDRCAGGYWPGPAVSLQGAACSSPRNARALLRCACRREGAIPASLRRGHHFVGPLVPGAPCGQVSCVP